MGISSWLFGQGVKEVGEGAATAMQGAGELLKDVRTSITGVNPDAELKIIEAQAKIAEAQASINAVEAANTNLFVSGWRPAIGWICAASLFYSFIIERLILWACTLSGITPNLPKFDFTDLMTIVLGMLGLSITRTYEKTKGVARD